MHNPLRQSVVLVVLSSLAASAVLAAKPPKNPPPPPLPPVRYQIQYWTIPGAIEVQDIYDTNSAGQTVGSFRIDLNGDGISDASRAYLYDPNVDTEFGVDLNLLVSNIPAGWSLRKATAINEVGQIVAYIEPNDAPLVELESVVIDLNQNPPVLSAIPDRSFTDYSLPGDINDWGDVIVRYRRGDGSFGHYVYHFDPASGITEPLDLGISTSSAHHPRINNAGDVVGPLGDGDAYRLQWNGAMETFVGLLPRALNEAGAFSGTATIVTGKGRNGTATRAFVFDDSLQLFEDGFNHNGIDLNASGDLARYYHLYHGGLDKTFVLKDLLDPNDPDTATIEYSSDLFCSTTTDRDPVTDFPVLTGSSRGIMGIQLIPVPTN